MAPLERVPLPAELIYPLGRGAGAVLVPAVSPGQRVRAGDAVAEPAPGARGVSRHAAADGVVAAVESRPVAGAGAPAPCVVLAVEAAQRDLEPADGPVRAEPSLHALARVLCEAGVVGLGGAGFPTHLKLLAAHRAARTAGWPPRLVLNAVECEEPIGCDRALLAVHPGEVVDGAGLLAAALGLSGFVLALGSPGSPQLGAALARSPLAVEVREVRPVFGAGDERLLMAALEGRRRPGARIIAREGVLMINVGTAAAVSRAWRHGEPLMRRVVTVCDPANGRLRNLEAALGMPVAALVKAAGGSPGAGGFLLGGWRMGERVPDPRVPVTESTNCVVLAEPAAAQTPTDPCIRCGRCSEACPYGLQPQEMAWQLQSGGAVLPARLAPALSRCTLCHECERICPSHLPLGAWFRAQKRAHAAAEWRAVQAERARGRYQAREARGRRRALAEAEGPAPAEEVAEALARVRRRTARSSGA